LFIQNLFFRGLMYFYRRIGWFKLRRIWFRIVPYREIDGLFLALNSDFCCPINPLKFHKGDCVGYSMQNPAEQSAAAI